MNILFIIFLLTLKLLHNKKKKKTHQIQLISGKKYNYINGMHYAMGRIKCF
jgi:hypothetical protein